MTKMSSNQALEPLLHIISDVRLWDEGLDCTIDSFFTEVEKRARTRGWQQILLLDLPALGALYDQGLSTGFLDLKRIPEGFGKLDCGRFQDSWIFRSLLQHTFDGFGTFDATTPVEVVAATRQLLYLYKKSNFDCPEEAIYNAVTDYIEIEEDTYPPDGTWDHDVWIPCKFSFSESGDRLKSFGLGDRFWRICDLVFGRLTPRFQLLPSGVVPKHGPGAVSDVCAKGDKYAFPHWPSKLGGLFPSAQFGYANEYLAYGDSVGFHSEREPPARLLAVPKTFKGPRLIASEPTAHQFLQQGLMAWIRQHMPEVLHTCVNFLDQTPSQEICLDASRTGRFATVDLKSASDRLSCWVVERAFSSNQSLIAALHACRTRTIVDGTGTHADLSLRLKKFAAQGSAVTFPVQTIIYAGLAISAVLYDDGLRQVTSDDVADAARLVRVFGDDIVLPSPNVPTLAVALQALGLKVNASKTHYMGHFRESCGMDAYCGHDVTPVYIVDLQLRPGAEDMASWLEVSNSFHRAGLWRTASWMLQMFDKRTLASILTSHEAGPGLRAFTYCRGTRFHGRVRMNMSLHRQEAKVLCLSSIAEKRARGNAQDLFQYFVEKPHPETLWSAGVLGRDRVRLMTRWVPIHQG